MRGDGVDIGVGFGRETLVSVECGYGCSRSMRKAMGWIS